MTGPAIDAGLMLPMAPQAPSHLETGRTADPLHCRHIAVTGGTVDPGADMHYVREIDMVRQAVDPDPGDRLVPVPVSHQLLDFRSFGGNIQVAGTTVRYGRDAGYLRLISIAMAIEARDAV